MTALNDAERVTAEWTTDAVDPVLSTPVEQLATDRTSRYAPAWLPSRRFIAAVTAIGGMQLLATMDSTVAIVALPKIQDDLGLSDAGRSWVITAYVLTFGGLMLLGGRLGDTIGRKRTFIGGVALFTIASVLCAVAWDAPTLVVARLLQGVGSAIASPTGLALVATTFPKGPARNAATAVFGAMTAVGSVMGLVVGGALTELSWRLAFGVNVPLGLVMIYLARTVLNETHRERMKLDATGALLATLGCTAAVFGFSVGPEKGWISVITIGSGGVAVVAFLAFALVERSAENPVVPFSLFSDRNRLATFAAIFLAGGVLFTLTVTIGLYVQDIMGYSALRAGVGFIPFVIAMIVVPLTLSAVAGVGFDQIGRTSAIALRLQNLGGPVVLAVIQAVITSRTLYLGGTNMPVKTMNDTQLAALDAGYTYGLLWVAAVAVLVGGISLLIGYTAKQVAHAQEAQDAFGVGNL